MNPPTNGSREQFRADVQMQLVIDSDSYGDVGIVMDKIARAVRREIGDMPARFDFIGFNTHPCKAARMARMAQLAVSEPLDFEDSPSF